MKTYADGSTHREMERPEYAKPPIYLRPVDPATVRPAAGTVFLHIRYDRWKKSKAGLFLPNKAKDGRPKYLGLAISKEEFKIATVLAVADDIDWLKPGDRVVIPTNREQDGCALGDTIFNKTSDKTGGSYNVFMTSRAVLALVEDE